jgi:hypothetical protein
MPLKNTPKSSSKEEQAAIIQQNIKTLVDEGKPVKQAVAIAYDVNERSMKK